MTSPVIASRTGTGVTVASQTHTINLGSPNPGDLLVVSGVVPGGVSSGVPEADISYSGSGWNKVYTQNNFATGIAFWKVAEGSDQLRIFQFASLQGAYVCSRVTGHGSAVFIPAGSVSNSSTNCDPPNASITGSAQDCLVIAVAALGSAGVVASAAPASYSNLTTQSGSGGIGSCSVAIADRALSAITAENPGAFTNSASVWVGLTLLIPESAIPTNARPTQEAVEAISRSDPHLVSTQTVVEAISAFVNNAVTTQVAVESLSPQGHNAYVTQAAVEVLSGDPWPSGNRNKYRQIQIAC